MRNFSSLSQCFLFCTAILFSFKSFAVCTTSGTPITSSGTYTTNIVTCVDSSLGITLYNISGTVNMTGNITTAGSVAYGIDLYNDTGISNTKTVNLIGDITTTGNIAYGIRLKNNDISNTNIVNMVGNISTSNNAAYGILLTNYNSSGTNSNTVNMTGNISTTGSYARGIHLFNRIGTNNTNTVNITGNISMSGLSSHGIVLENASGTNNSNTLNMTGNISTSGLYSHGIDLKNDNGSYNTNTVNMTGNVSTTGSYAYGIYLYSSGTNNNNTVNMTGDVSTTGLASHGVSLMNYTNTINAANTVNMTGNITTSGTSAYALYLNNFGGFGTSSNTVNMMGRISATGTTSYAIYAINNGSTNSNTIQLNKGSSVIGGILGDGTSPANNFLKLNLGAGASYSFATEGFTVSDLNGRPMVSGSAHAAGIGNVSTASQSLYERTSQITQSLDDRVRTYDAKQNTSQDFWVNTYYSDSNRGGQGLSGSNLSFNQYRSGITAGFDIKNTFTPTELIVNYEYGKLNIDEGNQGISSNSIMAGALFPDVVKVFNGTLSARVLVGYSDFNGDRKVLTNDVAYNGSRNVTASYQSTNLTLGSAWTKTLYQTDKIILDTLVGVDLNTQHINSYSESDLFKWSGRTINQLQERVSLGMEIKPMVKPLTLFGRIGIERRDLLSGENQNFAINNTAVSYNDSNQRNTYTTLNAGAYYPLTPTIKAYAQVRYYDSDKNIDSLSGYIGISGQL